MCHNLEDESKQQFDIFVENGMPQKIVKSLEYTVKRRIKQHNRLNKPSAMETPDSNPQQQQQQQLQVQQQSRALKSSSSSPSSSSSCEGGATAADAEIQPSPSAQSDEDNFHDEEELTTDDCTCSNRSSSTDNSRSSSISAESGVGLNDLQRPQATTMTDMVKTAEPTPTTMTALPAANAITTTTTITTPTASSQSNLKIPKMCGRFRQIMATSPNTRKISHHDIAEVQQENEEDAIAVGTQMTKRLIMKLSIAVSELQKTKLYTILTSTTQPTHLAAIFIFSVVVLTIWPELIDSSKTVSSSSSYKQQHQHVELPDNMLQRRTNSTFATIVYLLSFAIHFGAQIWMTFVSGLSLYFSLPRHTFGQCQQILFPKYFALNAFLSICMLIVFMKYFITWSLASSLQMGTLAFSAFIEVTVRLYLAPPMLTLMQEKYKIEGTIGSGQEVGSIVQGDLAQCPHYQRIHKTFRRIHMTIAIGNIVILMCSCLHLYYLASKIQIN